MRSIHGFVVLAFVGLLVGSAAGQVTAPEVAPADEASESVDALLARWRQQKQRATSIATLYNNSNRQQREEIQDEFLSTMEETSDFIRGFIPQIEKVHAEQPDNAAVKNVMADLARICLDLDQLEHAFRMARPVAEVTAEPAMVHLLAGQVAYELGELDDAEVYLSRGKDLPGLEAGQKQAAVQLLGKIAKRREVLAKEKQRLAEDANGEPLPRIRLQTNRGDIVIELFENDLPNTVASLVLLAEKGFYHEKDFFRVEQAFGAIAGSPTNDGQGGPGYATLREEPKRGARPHLLGYVSMIPLTPKTNGSQFFIVLRPTNCERLDGRQDVVGRIVEGMDVAERLRPYDLVRTRIDIKPDKIVAGEVVRKRAHEYRPVTTGDLADERFQAAMQKFGDKKFEEAAQLFRAAIEYLPDNATLHFNLGATYMNLSKVPEAEERFREAIRLNPQHLKARQFLAGVLVERKQYDAAVAELNEALQLFPSDRSTLELLRRAEEVRKIAAQEAKNGALQAGAASEK
jgi:peptidyl-prolyl cis-trans isomerase B (cyclophilin B)